MKKVQLRTISEEIVPETINEDIETVDFYSSSTEYIRVFNNGTIVSEYIDRQYSTKPIKIVVNSNSDSTRFIVLCTPHGTTPQQYFLQNNGVNRVVRDYNLSGASTMQMDIANQDVYIRMEGDKQYKLIGYLNYTL